MTIPQALQIAIQHHQAGRLADAETLYRQILAVQPNQADALHFLGVLAQQTGHYEVALEWIRQAIALQPNNPAAHSNLGEAYRHLDRLDEAIASYGRALALNPDIPETRLNLGNALIQQGQPDEAIAVYRDAISLHPEYLEAHNNLGNALLEQGRHNEAIAAYRRALLIRPRDPNAHSNLIFALHFDPEPHDETLNSERNSWNRRFGDPLKESIVPHANSPDPQRVLRIGYVSPDLRDHVVGRNLIPLFEHHDRRNFEILCYSGVFRPDAFTERFRQRASRWTNTLGVSDDSLAEIIRRDGIDILVDLSQHTSGNRLPVFARKPAPVQCSFAGYPESTGLEAIDCRISDPHLESRPAGVGTTSHKRLCLIDSFWCYAPQETPLAINELPALANGFVTFGCLNKFRKVNEPTLRLWARVLARNTASRLVLLSDHGSHRQITLDVLAREGIEAHRVEFHETRPRNEYLQSYQRLDMVLDTFPYNGHTTSLDALWMGVPVVSLAGKTPVSRAGLSQLTNIGLPELVAHSEAEYIDIATRLAADLQSLAELRATLRPRMQASSLTDAPHFARNIEAAYRSMWQDWVNGQIQAALTPHA